MEKIIFRNLTNVKFQQLKNAISKNKLRPHLLGVFLDVKNEKIVVTNSHVLVAYDIDVMQDDGLKEVLFKPSPKVLFLKGQKLKLNKWSEMQFL